MYTHPELLHIVLYHVDEDSFSSKHNEYMNESDDEWILVLRALYRGVLIQSHAMHTTESESIVPFDMIFGIFYIA